MCAEIKIIYQDEYCIAIEKPAGMASAPLNEDENKTALYFVSKFCPEVMNVIGKKSVEGGLLHRLDTGTQGLLLFAKNQQFYNSILDSQKKGLFKKEYKAMCQILPNCGEILQGFPLPPAGSRDLLNSLSCELLVQSWFRKYQSGGKVVRPVAFEQKGFAKKKCNTSSIYSTFIVINEINNDVANVSCTISRGFRHQVRCHLAWCGLPVMGDFQYNPLHNQKNEKQMSFMATKITFPHPFFSKEITIQI
ncbi:MAG: hypothetical protein J6B32_03585 [Spirochaetaceae bacterium]|nr:hypothetical protein [Spirochaetaceae bacterium]MBO5236179.1 hypothetical protein [Spirochaetaceae bacterium]